MTPAHGAGNPAAISPLMTSAPRFPSATSPVRRRSTVEPPPNIVSVDGIHPEAAKPSLVKSSKSVSRRGAIRGRTDGTASGLDAHAVLPDAREVARRQHVPGRVAAHQDEVGLPAGGDAPPVVETEGVGGGRGGVRPRHAPAVSHARHHLELTEAWMRRRAVGGGPIDGSRVRRRRACATSGESRQHSRSSAHDGPRTARSAPSCCRESAVSGSPPDRQLGPGIKRFEVRISAAVLLDPDVGDDYLTAPVTRACLFTIGSNGPWDGPTQRRL